jgi:tol-pal system protein YbgF
LNIRSIILTLTAFLMFFAGGCASRREIVQFQQDLDMIENQLIAIQSQNAELSREIEKLSKSITTLREETHRTRADVISELSTFRDQAIYLRNQLDDTGSRMSRLMQNVEDQSRTAPSQDSLQSPNTEFGNDESDVSAIQPKKLYDAAYLDLSRQNYDLALSGFQEYLRLYPQSELADNAQYWIGEIYYVRNDYEKALEQFLSVEADYPNGRKVPAALLKAGYCLQELRRQADAKRIYEKIRQKYPQTQEAELAGDKLRNM